MKTWIIANPSAGTAGEKLSRVRELAAGRAEVELIETGGAGHARTLALDAAKRGRQRPARRVRIESRPGMWFNVDGELIGNGPVTFEAVPAALTVIVPAEVAPAAAAARAA